MFVAYWRTRIRIPNCGHLDTEYRKNQSRGRREPGIGQDGYRENGILSGWNVS